MRNVWVVVFALAAACGSGGHDGNGDDGGGGDAGGGSGVTLPAAACQLPGTQDGVRLGFPRIANRAPTTGDVHIKVLFVDFSDAVATQTPQQVMGILSPGAEQFYAAVSAGRMHLIFDPVYTWLRMSKPTSGYPWNPLTF